MSSDLFINACNDCSAVLGIFAGLVFWRWIVEEVFK